MADAILVNSAQSAVADTIEVFYTAPVGGAKVSSFSATNNTTSSKSYLAYIYDASGAALPAIVPQKIVVRDRFDLGAAIVGQLIPPSGTLRMESSDAASIAFRVTGAEL